MGKKRIIFIFFVIILFLLAIFISLVYYKDKYTVSFETGTSEAILTKYVSKNSKVSEPITPEKEGYVFIEWQLNGEKYDFNSNVKEDTILSAKWVKEEYIIIKYNTDSSYKIDSKKILKGSTIENLPVPNKEGYEFIGWYMNDKLYQNEEVFDNVELRAKYKKIEQTYNVGDLVLIIGNYSDSAYAINSEYSVAIGWRRRVLAIIEDSEYPYMIGNDNGVTGFFKSDSIEHLNIKEKR